MATFSLSDEGIQNTFGFMSNSNNYVNVEGYPLEDDDNDAFNVNSSGEEYCNYDEVLEPLVENSQIIDDTKIDVVTADDKSPKDVFTHANKIEEYMEDNFVNVDYTDLTLISSG